MDFLFLGKLHLNFLEIQWYKKTPFKFIFFKFFSILILKDDFFFLYSYLNKNKLYALNYEMMILNIKYFFFIINHLKINYVYNQLVYYYTKWTPSQKLEIIFFNVSNILYTQEIPRSFFRSWTRLTFYLV